MLTPNETALIDALRRMKNLLKTFPLPVGFNGYRFCQICWAPSPEGKTGEAPVRVHRTDCALNNLVLEATTLISHVEGGSETKQG